MALGHLTPDTATVELPLAPSTPANAARARAEFLRAEASRLNRVANGYEKPQESDNALGAFHLTLTGMVTSYLDMAREWEVREVRAARRGRPQPILGAKVDMDAPARR